MAIVMKTDLISDDLWTLPEPHADIYQLQAKDFTKWLRKQVRQFGRKAIVGSQQVCPVEAWVEEVTEQKINFICGGEVVICHPVNSYFDQHLFTDWSSACYYMFDEDGNMVIEAGKMLDIILLDDQEAYLIAR